MWPDDQLEAVHDFIQWLFPLPEPSGFNAAAPILNRESMQEFRKRPELHQNLRVSFLRMMKFYGLEVDFAEQIKVTRTRYFAAKATIWLSPGNHNHLRITRILRCLSFLGLEAEARAFFECLSEIYEFTGARCGAWRIFEPEHFRPTVEKLKCRLARDHLIRVRAAPVNPVDWENRAG